MQKAFIVQKKEMARIPAESGEFVPVTRVLVVPQEVVSVTDPAHKDGVQITLGAMRYKHPSKNRLFRLMRSFWLASAEGLSKGQVIDLDGLAAGSMASLTSVSKGKGFQGVIHRWGFHGGPGSHGSHFKREPGSIGQRARPGKVQKGKKLPGHQGVKTVTLHNRPIVQVDAATQSLYIKGPVPGGYNTIFTLMV